MVPMVSKKSAKRSVKTRRRAVINGTRSNEPKRLNDPRSPKSGVATTDSGIAGTLRFQPFGFTLPVAPSNNGPTLKALSIATASAVETMMPIRRAALTFRTIKPIVRKRPNAKTITGHPTSSPLLPRVTGTGPVPVRRTKPASTRPISAINRPIPTEIAILS